MWRNFTPLQKLLLEVERKQHFENAANTLHVKCAIKAGFGAEKRQGREVASVLVKGIRAPSGEKFDKAS